MNTYVMPYITKDGKLLKPIWLSEWGVYSGGANAASALGMADVYLYMSEHQDIYTRANWFSVNGKLNSFVVLNDKRQPAKPYQKTLFGSTHEIMRSVFEDAQLLESTMSTAKLTGTTVNAVNARAVVKDGKTMVVAVNLTNKPAQFTLKFNGAIYRGAYVHDAMTFKTMDEERILGFDENPLNFNMRSTGSITLPAYSVNKLSGFVASAATSTPTPIATATSKPTATSTPKPVATATSKPTATSTPKPVATATPTATSTPKPTATLAPTATPVANNECSAIQNVAWDARTEIDIAAGNCVQFDRDLKGKTVQFWDSDVNTSCDFRGFARSIDGTGAVAIDSNYLATTALSGKTLKLLRANDNTCKYIKLRAY